MDNLIKTSVTKLKDGYKNRLTVTSKADRGAETLRWCLENASPRSYITFDSKVFPSDIIRCNSGN